jgi:hypothetical protein
MAMEMIMEMASDMAKAFSNTFLYLISVFLKTEGIIWSEHKNTRKTGRR